MEPLEERGGEVGLDVGDVDVVGGNVGVNMVVLLALCCSVEGEAEGGHEWLRVDRRCRLAAPRNGGGSRTSLPVLPSAPSGVPAVTVWPTVTRSESHCMWP